MADTLPSFVIEGVASLIEKAGQDPFAIAKSVELNPKALYQPDILISEIKTNDLFEEAARVCDERFLGLKLGQTKGIDIIGPLWLLARHEATVGDVIIQVANNLAVHSQGLVAIVKDEGEAGLSMGFEPNRLKLDVFQKAPKHYTFTQVVELSLTVCCQEFRGSLGRDWFPQYVQFRHAAPSDLKPLKKVFGNNLFFNQDENALHLSREDCQQPNYRNPVNKLSSKTQKILEREFEARVGQGSTFVQRVGRIIRTLINDQGATAGEVAKTLDIPVRTLQYRLKKHNTSYQALYDTMREDLAKQYLSKSELSISAISERLHFTDTAALSKFFKARIGLSPREYAKRMRLLDQ